MTPSATTTHQQQEPRREMRPTNALNTDALARLPPAQVREMREAFQVLDRDGDGLVTREDVAEILSSL
ncbi:calmodulin, partial [Lasallia pustulata]